MPGGGLIALLDDMAGVMESVALMAKANAKVAAGIGGQIADKTGQALGKTAGVVGDDIALGAETLRVSELEQRIGLAAKKEWSIVKKVAKGSAANKVWITAAVLGLAGTAPILLHAALLGGGLFLSMEGAEKVSHAFKDWRSRRSGEALSHGEGHKEELPPLDAKSLIEWEAGKIKGAVRTDMVLSGEIMLIAAGQVAGAPLLMQAATLAAVGAAMTVGVYGAVGALVKLDDLGLALKRYGDKKDSEPLRKAGLKLMTAMPTLMKGLTVAGVGAMLAVGGGIVCEAAPLLSGLAHIGGAAGYAAVAAAGLGIGLAAEAGLSSAPGSWLKEAAGSAIGKLSRSLSKLAKSLKPSGRKPKAHEPDPLEPSAFLESAGVVSSMGSESKADSNGRGPKPAEPAAIEPAAAALDLEAKREARASKSGSEASKPQAPGR